MAIDVKKIQEYYRLLQTKKLLDKKLAELNETIKNSLEPGEHLLGDYKINLTLRRKYEIDPMRALDVLDPEVFKSCTYAAIDPDAIESIYLLGMITDEELRTIRGEAKIIQSLSVEHV